jgi:CheY-like chemotaxis protein
MFVNNAHRAIRILIAEDDPDDRMLVEDAFNEARLGNEVEFAFDGVDLIEKLAALGPTRLPDLIMLDLNMPRMDGREALRALKESARYRHIPVIILTTSKAEEDVLRSYDTGASSYITKPVSFQGMLDVLNTLGQYWAVVVTLPDQHRY